MRSPPAYVLGSDDAEVARLDAQATAIAPPTALLLRAAGIGPGMRVLDLGTGLGHVAFAVAELVGPEGAVVGLDTSATLLEHAERRRRALGPAGEHVRLLERDARTYRPAEAFDAVVARLLLFHLPDAVEVVAHHAENLRAGGRWVALDFDIGSARAEPEVPLITTAAGWIEAAFRAARADPRVGARLARILTAAGLTEVETFGLQRYLAPDDPTGSHLLAGVVGALAEPIVANGIATADELGLDTFQARVAAALVEADSTMLPPAVVGAWGVRA